jgi:hypothetical protein
MAAERRICEACDVPFMARTRKIRYCTKECAAATSRVRNRGKYKTSRAAILRGKRKKRQRFLENPTVAEAAWRKQFVKRQLIIAKYKLDRGCADCGYNKHACVLQFDHVRGTKIKGIAASHSLTFFYSEVQKCEVVCANCHALRTFGRKHISRGFSLALDDPSDNQQEIR